MNGIQGFVAGRRVRGWLLAALCAGPMGVAPMAAAQEGTPNCGTFLGQTLLPISGAAVTATPNLTGACIGCSVLNPALAANASIDDAAVLTRGIGLFGGVSLRIRNPATTYGAGRVVGVLLEGPAELLAADLLPELEVNTYLDGVARDTTSESPGLLAPLLDLNALSLLPGEAKRLVAFRVSNSFNEIELRLPATVTLLTEVKMYAACVAPLSTTIDSDNDGRNDNVDNCPDNANEGQLDSDGDGIGDACDNCPTNSNANQLNSDSDALGNACDTDDDNDGDLDPADNCPLVANPDQANADGDAQGDACDIPPLDGDGDGRPDSTDNCPTVANANQADADADGIGDACDNPGNVSCGTNGAHKFRPLLLPNAATLGIIEQICLLCSINDQDNAINANPNDYATVLRPVSALVGSAALRARSTNTVYPAGRQAALIVEDPADLLSADLLPQLQINTYLGETLRESNQQDVGSPLPPLLDLDLLELFGEGGRKLLVINTSQSFDGLELKLPSTVTALSEIRLFNACVEIPATNPPDPDPEDPECETVISPAPPGYCTDDVDSDGRPNANDNCPNTANANQLDRDGDGRGDVCDSTPNGPDPDGDGRGNLVDNCPNVSNANQADSDGDGIGDACEANASTDSDGDGITNNVDNCPTVSNASQADSDGDGIGNACDTTNSPDGDGDGISNATDNCPTVRNADQADGDDDGIGDACDLQNEPDGDNDSAPDSTDNCPTIANASQDDGDGDGIGDACDSSANGPDGDNDGIPDNVDNCPSFASDNQADTDGDGIGDVCDSTPGTGSGEDLVPDAIQFSRLVGVALNEEMTSQFVRITGISAPTTIQVAGGSYSIDSGAFTTAPGTIASGQLVRVRHVSSSAYAATTATTLNVGGVVGRFESVTTDVVPTDSTGDDGGGAFNLWLLAAAALWRRRAGLRLR